MQKRAELFGRGATMGAPVLMGVLLLSLIDPVAIAHAKNILGPSTQTTAILADLRKPATVLRHPKFTRTLDLTQPIGLLCVSVFHFIPDELDREPGR